MSFGYILWSSVISLQLFGEVEIGHIFTIRQCFVSKLGDYKTFWFLDESDHNFFLSFCLAGAEALVCIDDEEEVVQVKAQQVISITETLALNEDIM